MKSRRTLLAGIGAALIGGLTMGAANAQNRINPGSGPAPGGPINDTPNGYLGPDGYNPGSQGLTPSGNRPGSGSRNVGGPQPAGTGTNDVIRRMFR